MRGSRPGLGGGRGRKLSIRIVGVLLGFLVVAGLASPGRADVLQDLGATYQKAAEELAAAFPKVEVQVTAVTGDTLRVEGAQAGSLRPGLELTVFRRGAAFRHPTTGQVLGHAEQVLGTLVVTVIEPSAATGRLMPAAGQTAPAPVPAPGDGARITAGRIPVAVLPTAGVQAAFESTDQTRLLLVARLSALLEKTGRFLAVDPQRVLDVLDKPQGSSPSPLEVGRRLGGVAVLTSRLGREGATRVLEMAWISGQTGDTLATLRTPLRPGTYPPRFAWEETPELERRYPLDGPVRALALGDLDGDGRTELVVADEQAVAVQRATEGGPLVPVEGAVYRPGGLIIAADVAPLRGTPRAQIVIVSVRADEGRAGLVSQVLEWTPGKFQVVHESSGRYLRVVRVGAEPWLLEQDAGAVEPFERETRRLVWNGTKFEDGMHFRLPPRTSVFGLALMRLSGRPEPEVVVLTPDDRLTVWSPRGQLLWTSSDTLGGSAVTFNYGPAASRSPGVQDGALYRVPGRVIPLAEGSESEVLVYQNLLPALEQGRGVLPRLAATLYNRGRVLRLRWRDGAFLRVWQSAVTQGYIADLGYGDLDGDGIPEVLVGVVPRGFDLEALNPLGRVQGRIVSYELP